MHFGEVILVLIINAISLFFLYHFQNNRLERRIKRLKKEVEELEDLVAAIIEEFETIANDETTANDKTTKDEYNPNLEPLVLNTNNDTAIDNTNRSQLFTMNTAVKDPRHQNILELRQEGLTVEEIAKRLGTGQGEIKLILGLYQKG